MGRLVEDGLARGVMGEAVVISGIEASALTRAKPMMWVKLTLPPRLRARWLLMTMRLSMSSLAGTARTLVAVGTSREDSMFVTTRALAPRIGTSSPSVMVVGAAGASMSRGFGADGVEAVAGSLVGFGEGVVAGAASGAAAAAVAFGAAGAGASWASAAFAGAGAWVARVGAAPLLDVALTAASRPRAASPGV